MTGVLALYQTWLATATQEQIEFVDSVYKLCNENYSAGGDVVVETFDPPEVLKEFKNLNDVREYCGFKVEQALNARWGEDNDPEVERSKAFDKWPKSESNGQEGNTIEPSD